MQVIFPKLSTIAYADTIIKNCANVQKTRDISTFVFEKTTFIDPFAITIIAGAIQGCLRTKNRKIAYIPPKDRKLKDYLSQIGFNSFFHINGKNIHKDTSVELTQLMALRPLYIEKLIILIESKMSLSKGMKDSLKMSLQELLINVFDHSRSNSGCFVCAQYYPNKMLIRLCITDFGVGILSTLKKKYKITSDIKAIKLSVEEGVTSRPQSAGFGLTHIRKFLKINKGVLTIISGRGKVDFYSNRVAEYNMAGAFEGTIVNLEINTNKKSLYFLTGEEDYIF
ncbi:MAG: hypothetical protein AB1711_04665 [Thermodesulfobacteriota bacterium]